ncbi:GTPase IMAP family member GIMD1 [Latimeria chalumnae]|uniref:GTPase IMAP family member GIMD1 n=1 Tax=Latimeria chalumnae TaxID=7897 RepID=H3AT84_LATCH|nr:PREDICTED: GTPase IMAP family member GIMD1 [Latimeria chalumnae]|eukprot:XP_006006768.1 PREDICTED: GTPase IMAP family member GIMD1 [Latimeria chalumnae]
MSSYEEMTLNCLLLGRSQSGKSATGNCLIGSYEFESQLSFSSLTQECKHCSTCISNWMRRNGKELRLRVNVLDTPGYPHSRLSNAMVKQVVQQDLRQYFKQGLHLALLVLRADLPLCEEDNQIVQLAQSLLGPSWKTFTAVIITHRKKIEEAGLEEKDYLLTASEPLKALLSSVQHRYLFVAYSPEILQAQRRQLLTCLVDFIRQNGYRVLEFQ